MPDEPIGTPDPEDLTTLPAAAGGSSPVGIGPYRILQKLGEGGMGEVYLAEQVQPIQRRVALKVVKPGMDSREVLARFKAERQAIAVMDHPCIARALDAGTTEQGRPYFVMEYVQGLPITQYCDRHKLGTRERLRLFARVCDGVQHAHQKAIIHRDLKPHNVLVTEVDDQPVPKIIDFGVAKAIGSSLSEHSVYTALGQLIGTPEYMSPEQFEMGGEGIDTRTDIYSLGGILYELLAGSPPFDTENFRRDGYEAIRKRVCEVEPPRPSTRVSLGGEKSTLSARNRNSEPGRLASELRGDLDWITLKALEKDRTRRYPSASEFAQDIQRYLNDETVLAAPPSAAHRAAKLLRRHRGAVTALAAIFAILVVTSIVSMSLYFRAQRESARAREEATRSAQVSQFMRDMLAGVGPSVAMGRDTRLLREILEQTAKRVDVELAGQPRVDAEMRAVLGETYADLGDYDRAKPFLDRSVATFTKEAGADDPQTLGAMNQKAGVFARLGDMPAAESLYAEVARRAGRQDGAGHVQALVAEGGLASVYYYMTELEKADSVGTPALAGLRRAVGERDPRTLGVMLTMAQVQTDARQYEAAESLYTQLIRVLGDVHGPDYPMLLSARVGLGWTYRLAHRYEDAARETRAALDAERRVLGSDHAETLVAINNMAIIYKDLGDFARAEPLYIENVERGFKVQGERHPEAIAGVVNLASFYGDRGRYREAITRADQALRLFRGVVPDDFIGVGIAHEVRGQAYRHLGRDAEAEKDLLAAEKVLLPLFGPEHPKVKGLRAGLAEVATRMGKPDDAARWRKLAEGDGGS